MEADEYDFGMFGLHKRAIPANWAKQNHEKLSLAKIQTLSNISFEFISLMTEY